MNNQIVIGFGFGILWLDIILNCILFITGGLLLLVSRNKKERRKTMIVGSICLIIGFVGLLVQLLKILNLV